MNLLERQIKAGTVNLTNIITGNDASLTIHFEHAINVNSGIRINKGKTINLEIPDKARVTFYGNTLMKGFIGDKPLANKTRMIQLNNILLINADIILKAGEQTFTLERELGLLIINQLKNKLKNV